MHVIDLHGQAEVLVWQAAALLAVGFRSHWPGKPDILMAKRTLPKT